MVPMPSPALAEWGGETGLSSFPSPCCLRVWFSSLLLAWERDNRVGRLLECFSPGWGFLGQLGEGAVTCCQYPGDSDEQEGMTLTQTEFELNPLGPSAVMSELRGIACTFASQELGGL